MDTQSANSNHLDDEFCSAQNCSDKGNKFLTCNGLNCTRKIHLQCAGVPRVTAKQEKELTIKNLKIHYFCNSCKDFKNSVFDGLNKLSDKQEVLFESISSIHAKLLNNTSSLDNTVHHVDDMSNAVDVAVNEVLKKIDDLHLKKKLQEIDAHLHNVLPVTLESLKTSVEKSISASLERLATLVSNKLEERLNSFTTQLNVFCNNVATVDQQQDQLKTLTVKFNDLSDTLLRNSDLNLNCNNSVLVIGTPGADLRSEIEEIPTDPLSVNVEPLTDTQVPPIEQEIIVVPDETEAKTTKKKVKKKKKSTVAAGSFVRIPSPNGPTRQPSGNKTTSERKRPAKKPDPPSVVTSQDSTVKSVPVKLSAAVHRKWLHVSRLKTDTTAEALQNFIRQKIGCSDVICKPLCRTDTDPSSLAFVNFKLGLPSKFFTAALSPSTWPRGIKVREFSPNPYKSTSSDEQDFQLQLTLWSQIAAATKPLIHTKNKQRHA